MLRVAIQTEKEAGLLLFSTLVPSMRTLKASPSFQETPKGFQKKR